MIVLKDIPIMCHKTLKHKHKINKINKMKQPKLTMNIKKDNNDKTLFKIGTEIINDSLMISAAHLQSGSLLSFEHLSQISISLLNDVCINLSMTTSLSSEKPSHFFSFGDYSMYQRFMSLYDKAVIFSLIGFMSGSIGYVLFKQFEYINNVMLWLTYLSIFSNIRYQIVSGLERIYDHYYFIIFVRLINNYIGACIFMWWKTMF